MESLHYDTISSPIGKILVVMSNRGLLMLHFPLESSAENYLKHYFSPSTSIRFFKSTTKTASVRKQLRQYFKGQRRRFRLPLDLQGTAFQTKVWKELLEIPFGRTASYGELAKRIGAPKASRAVGMANNKNKIGIVIPCHRVIGSNGKLVGYAGGMGIKRTLLQHEQKVVLKLNK